MPLHEAVSTYFQGEKIEALVFILPLGLLAMIFGAWLLTDVREPFARGAAWPFLVLGLALAVTGGTVGFRTPAQVARVEAGLVATPAETLSAEQARMAKVNAAWPIYATTFLAFALVGLGLRFALQSELARGIGVALVFFGGVGFVIDGFAERRARVYVTALHAPGSALRGPSAH